jgi:microcystin-dependent protein
MGGVSADRLTGLSGGVDGDVLGNTGGAETHTLSIAQMPDHTHSLQNGVGTKTNSFDSGTHVASDAGGFTGSQGNGDAHNNVQPTIILNYIIKT